LAPPALFLFATSLERRAPSAKFPYGLHWVGSLAFFAAATALTAMGGFLIFQAVRSLIAADHPTIGSVSVFGHDVWLGWLMMAALLYSVVPPIVLGRMKRLIAKRTRDKVLYTDADMNAADWQTGLAGIVGVAGIGLGWWWADAVAPGFISISILKDGITNLRIATAELVDGMPRRLDSPEISPAADQLLQHLKQAAPGQWVQIRETGRYMRAVVSRPDDLHIRRAAHDLLGDDDWALIEVSAELDLMDEMKT
jgi:divalent metal cation (Fe/Co/Zn/Cd) transporter